MRDLYVKECILSTSPKTPGFDVQLVWLHPLLLRFSNENVHCQVVLGGSPHAHCCKLYSIMNWLAKTFRTSSCLAEMKPPFLVRLTLNWSPQTH